MSKTLKFMELETRATDELGFSGVFCLVFNLLACLLLLYMFWAPYLNNIFLGILILIKKRKEKRNIQNEIYILKLQYETFHAQNKNKNNQKAL